MDSRGPREDDGPQTTECLIVRMTAAAPSPVHDAKRDARRQFDAWASRYDRSILNTLLFEPSYLLMLEEIARWRQDRVADGEPADRPFRLLDVGCGTATFAGLLLATGWPVEPVCVDYSQNMCVEARNKLSSRLSPPIASEGNPESPPSAAVVNADSEHLPFAAEQFDIVTCANSFHHYPRQGNVVQEMHRILKPNGRLVLLDGFRDNCIGWFVFDVVVSRVEANVHHATWREIDGMFRGAGFRQVTRRRRGALAPVLATIGTR